MPETLLRPYLVELGKMTVKLEATENQRGKVLVYMNDAPFICFMKSIETGRYEFMNRRGLETLGMTEEQVVGKTDWELFPKEMANVLIAHDVQLLQTRKSFVAIERRNYGNRTALYLVSKFLVMNGEESIGGIAVEVPDTFQLSPTQTSNGGSTDAEQQRARS